MDMGPFQSGGRRTHPSEWVESGEISLCSIQDGLAMAGIRDRLYNDLTYMTTEEKIKTIAPQRASLCGIYNYTYTRYQDLGNGKYEVFHPNGGRAFILT